MVKGVFAAADRFQSSLLIFGQERRGGKNRIGPAYRETKSKT